MPVYSLDNCPTEILTRILNYLKSSTLLICMQVCSKWRDIAFYIVMHQREGFKTTLCKKLEDNGTAYRRKSKIKCDSLYFNSILWLNINNAQIHYAGPIPFTQFRDISVYKDNLIIVSDEGVTYIDVNNLHIRRHFDLDCDKFEENDFMVVMQKAIADTEEISLVLYAKESESDFNFTNNPKFHTTVCIYKLDKNGCYVINRFGQISVISRIDNEMTLHTQFMFRYYGSLANIAAIHITRSEKYNMNFFVILKSGAIILYNPLLHKHSLTCLHFKLSDVNMRYFVTPFHYFGAVFQTTKDFEVNQYSLDFDFLLIQCPGLTCVTDHGNILLFGCDDGMVKIFLKKRLLSSKDDPELTIDIKSYLPSASSYEIRTIDVHEKLFSHILFIRTDTVTVKLSITHPELNDCDEDVENGYEKYLSVIHLLKIK